MLLIAPYLTSNRLIERVYENPDLPFFESHKQYSSVTARSWCELTLELGKCGEPQQLRATGKHGQPKPRDHWSLQHRVPDLAGKTKVKDRISREVTPNKTWPARGAFIPRPGDAPRTTLVAWHAWCRTTIRMLLLFWGGYSRQNNRQDPPNMKNISRNIQKLYNILLQCKNNFSCILWLSKKKLFMCM